MYISEISNFLEELAPPSYQESYDNCGLLVGNRNTLVSKALITLDVTEDVIDEAIMLDCELIIAHHPLIFGGIKKLNGNGFVERCIIKAIKHDIAIYVIHTNLDNVYHGVNDKIADKLGLQDRHILAPKDQQLCKLVTFVPVDHADGVREAICNAGAGHIGNYDFCSYNNEGFGTFRGNEQSQSFAGKKGEIHREPEIRMEVILPVHLKEVVTAVLLQVHPYEEAAYDFYALLNRNSQVGSGLWGTLPKEMNAEEWLAHLKQSMDLKCIRHTDATGKPVRKVAVCGGSGSFLLKDALRIGADVLVTADFKYHEFFNADGRLMICDIGHYESEIFTTELLRDKLLRKFSTFAAQISNTRTNPVNYYL